MFDDPLFVEFFLSFNCLNNYKKLIRLNKQLYYIIINTKIVKKIKELYYGNESGVYYNACDKGYLNVIKLYYKTDYSIEYAFYTSCIHTHLDIAKWLYSLDCNKCNTCFNQFILYTICDGLFSIEDNIMNMVIWLDTLNNPCLKSNYSSGYIAACKKGYLKLSKWFYNTNLIDINYLDSIAFIYSCKFGHIDVAKWLLSINIYINNLILKKAFSWSCINGHINIAKWLYLEYGKQILKEIFIDDNITFGGACREGHFELAQWLYGLDIIDIKKQFEYAFHKSQKNNHHIINNWLLEIERLFDNQVIVKN